MNPSVEMSPPRLARFVGEVVRIAEIEPEKEKAIEAIDPAFRGLLSQPDFLDEEYTRPIPGKFAQYLLYRNEDRSLSVMAMVVPAGTATPVHDHLAWGLVGVYQGSQRETVYRRVDGRSNPGRARLKQVGVNILRVGDITHLLPPEGDIHKIETLDQAQASISIHILANDIGCKWRHAFDVEKDAVYDFRSGYVNAECED